MTPQTPQQLADQFLADWQRQRLAGIPAKDRVLPANDDLERELEIIRRCMERKS